ncbi:MAG TPA: hypothetical protein VN784_10835 [Candidatus Limnocylindrales bacterium]|nr:hypothetical protein [Candidatus Limnocylindrales bacterium]
MKRHFVQIGKPALAALLVGVVLLLDAMAACPALHEMIHHDAGKEDHDCAVTMLALGKMDSATCEIIVPEPTVLVQTVQYFIFPIFSPAIENLPQGRAPPALRSVS